MFLKMIKEYSWLYEVYEAIKNHKKLPVTEINLVGSRYSGKSMAIQILYAMLCLLPDKIGLYALRSSVKGGKELFVDIRETFNLFGGGFKFNKGDKTIRSKTNEVRVIGLNSMSSYAAKESGLSKISGVKYIIKYYEERFEFSETDFKACEEAIRGVGEDDIQVLTINVCNPGAKSNPYIAYCAKNQEWNLSILKKTGNQIAIKEYTDPETLITVRKVFQYTNGRITKHFLAEGQINSIKETWNTDRNRAQVVDWGLPGYEGGAIYTHLLNKIGIPILQHDPEGIIAGMDYGGSQTGQGGKTAAVFGVASMEYGIDIYSEYIQDPAIRPVAPDIIANEVVNFYLASMKDYCSKINRSLPFYVKVKVDNMAVGVINLLNQASRKLGCSNWLSFIRSAKYPVVDRIDIQQAIMSKGLFRMDINCKQLLSDLETAHYKEDTEDRKRVKENDHALNAYEYGLETCMYAMARKTGVDMQKQGRFG